MSNAEAQDSFELRVEFAGLCLYMIDDPQNFGNEYKGNTGTANKLAILMPDARKSAKVIHDDGSRGEAHVGYVRFDLANIDMGDAGFANLGVQRLAEPGGVDDHAGSPPNEIVHRFNGEVLDFGLDNADAPVGYDIGIPSFNAFADSLIPIAGVFDPIQRANDIPPQLLMRTVLNGGNISANGSGKTWTFSSVLKERPNGRPYANQFAGYAVWTQQVQKPGLVVTIKKFDGSVAATIPLKPVPVPSLSDDPKLPVPRRITIKIANLCAHNPLEWRDYPIRTVGDRDIDFKWLYRLMRPKALDYQKTLRGAEFPFPREVSVQAFGDEDCMGGTITTPF